MSQQTLHQILETIPDAIVVVDQRGVIVHVNTMAANLFGYSHEELLGQTVEVLIPPGLRDQHIQDREAYSVEPVVRPMGTDLDLQARRKDGSEFPVEINLSPMDTEAGPLVISTIRDITKRNQKLEDLGLSEERFRVVSESMTDVIWEADIPANQVSWFGDIDGLLGYGPGEFPRTMDGWWDIIHTGDLEGVNAAVDRLLVGGADYLEEYRVVNKDGETRHWQDRGKVIRWEDGVGVEAVGSITDITEQKQAQQELTGALQTISKLRTQLEMENAYLREEIESAFGWDEIVGDSSALAGTLAKVAQVAPTTATVLIQGETGTGKELIARAIHTRSERKSHPLIRVDCASLPASLIESELFGHTKGAFTGALRERTGRFKVADGGTIFLDEIGELPIELQPKLLRVLESGEFEKLGSSKTIKTDVRVIAATNHDLGQSIVKGSFRRDLFHRLHVFPIHVPPLRERPDDIPLLAKYFLTMATTSLGKSVEAITPETMERLVAYAWPGNVRELKHIIERAVIISQGPNLELAESLGMATVMGSETTASKRLDDIERAHILDVLEECDWAIKGKDHAADRLGLHPSTLRHRLKKLGIQRPVVH